MKPQSVLDPGIPERRVTLYGPRPHISTDMVGERGPGYPRRQYRTAAGQSIPRLPIHVIPRYKGDVENPRGGVRGFIPDKKLYTLVPD